MPYAVIFSSQLKNSDGYHAMAAEMAALAEQQPGFLGMESCRSDDGFGITVSYWDSLEAIRRWKAHPRHKAAQEQGKTHWYESYSLRIALLNTPF